VTLHLALMGGPGLGTRAVLAIAGRMHCGVQPGLPLRTRAGLALVVAATLLRALSETGLAPWPPGPVHGSAAVPWWRGSRCGWPMRHRRWPTPAALAQGGADTGPRCRGPCAGAQHACAGAEWRAWPGGTR
jgi:hypothetical protein